MKMDTYKITGYIETESNVRQNVKDIVNVDRELSRNELANEYIVRWAMVKQEVIADFSLEIERI
jgi:hypothetical protein